MTMNGLFLIDKAAGCTSHDVVGDVRRALGQKKVGHCGTLDPMATGLLLVTAGHATRLTRFLIGAPKVYEGKATFGTTTDTYDAHGTVTHEADPTGLELERIDACLAGIVGHYDQTAPPYSAKKVKGKKLYELARAGLEVPERKSVVEVFSLDRISPLENNTLSFRLSCASGTYARSIVHDLGQRLNTGAHLSGLRRTSIGPFKLEDATPQETLHAMATSDDSPSLDGNPAWIGFDQIPLPFQHIVLDARGERRIQNGQTLLSPKLDAEEGDWIKVQDSRGKFLAVGVVAERVARAGIVVVQPKIVFK